jgi:hypothetical protein
VNTLFEFSISILLAGLVVLIHYEALRLISLKELTVAPRKRILLVIFAAFVAHLVEITLYALSYVTIAKWIGSGAIGGLPTAGFYDYFYYSITAYTTLGIGDYYPMEGLRILTGMESLVGLMMITWTASFTYLNMEKFWKLHR